MANCSAAGDISATDSKISLDFDVRPTTKLLDSEANDLVEADDSSGGLASSYGAAAWSWRNILPTIYSGCTTVGHALGSLLVYITIGDSVAPDKRGFYDNLNHGIFSISTVLGPILGSAFTDNEAGWRWYFDVILPLAGFSLTLYFFVGKWAPKYLEPESPSEPESWSAVGICIAVAMMLSGLTYWGSSHIWDSLVPLSILLVVGIVLCVLVVAVGSYYAPRGLRPAGLFGHWNFNVCNWIGLAASMQLYGCIFFIPFYHRIIFNESSTDAGLSLLPFVAAFSITSVVTSALAYQPTSACSLARLGSVLLAGSMAMLMYIDTKPNPLLENLSLILFGISSGLIYPSILAITQLSLPEESWTQATIAHAFFKTLGGIFGLALFQATLKQSFEDQVHQDVGADISKFDPVHVSTLPDPLRLAVLGYLVAGFRAVWATAMVVSLMAGFGSLLMRAADARGTKKVDIPLLSE
ncbi:major facilitator superfamily domain-containing protein [Polychytrium aggregatum]|uniref:major facilitator superfamily domain-containing protein n=1 Tax=Polychytrium aggregatum TaxID=110093 RepID=UPI0022FF2056|nr:major facilitator superfamily domain-containing protein [Polychytrium aggregatum]KAI9208760.1 major facilitator superfamily domain-containing protein [Polychytrium aggregatum]